MTIAILLARLTFFLRMCTNESIRTLDNKGDDTTATKLKIKLIAGKNMLPSLYGKPK
jgi:hypothetical protein